MKKFIKSNLKWIIAVVVVIIAGLAYFQAQNKSVHTGTMTVSPSTVENSFIEEGVVSSLDKTDIYAPISSSVKSLSFSEGDMVKAGDILFTMDTGDLNIQINQLKNSITSTNAQIAAQNAAVEQASAQLGYIELQIERMRALFEQGVVSQSQLDELEYQHKSVAASLDSAQKQVGYLKMLSNETNTQIVTIEEKINKSVVKAPASGKVTSKNIEVGQTIPAGYDALVIAADKTAQIESFVRAQDVALLKNGDSVDIILKTTASDIANKGKITDISKSAEERLSSLGISERRVKVKIAVNDDGFTAGDGYSVDIKFTTGHMENVVAIPKTAVFPYNGGYAVFTVVNGEARITPIEQGTKTTLDVVITKGLSFGDIIITDPPSEGITNGTKIK